MNMTLFIEKIVKEYFYYIRNVWTPDRLKQFKKNNATINIQLQIHPEIYWIQEALQAISLGYDRNGLGIDMGSAKI